MKNRHILKAEISAFGPLVMPLLQVAQRISSFDEVEMGLSREQAIQEAQRCMGCTSAPCVKACPLKIAIPTFIGALCQADLATAARILSKSNPFPAVCGRICPQELQCENSCVLGTNGSPVAVGALERFVADWALEYHNSDVMRFHSAETGKKIAVIGGGVAGLSAAADLAGRRHHVKIYESQKDTGGVLLYEIPEFRLPKKVVVGETARIISLGVWVECNAPVGRKISFGQLRSEYDAILVTNGAGLPILTGISGENLQGVYSSREYLTRTNLTVFGLKQRDVHNDMNFSQVVVIGGGNTALDCARVARRFGADRVTILYRRGERDMPARLKEIEFAKQEGVKILEWSSPVEFLSDQYGRVTGLAYQKMRPGAIDSSGRPRPVPVPGAQRELVANAVIYALGTSYNPIMTGISPGLADAGIQKLLVNSDGSTSIPGVFAGGDALRGCGTAVQAIADGKRAAVAIHSFLMAGDS